MFTLGTIKKIETKLVEIHTSLEINTKVEDAQVVEAWSPHKIALTIGTGNKRHLVEFQKNNGDLFRIIHDDSGKILFPKT